MANEEVGAIAPDAVGCIGLDDLLGIASVPKSLGDFYLFMSGGFGEGWDQSLSGRCHWMGYCGNHTG